MSSLTSIVPFLLVLAGLSQAQTGIPNTPWPLQRIVFDESVPPPVGLPPMQILRFPLMKTVGDIDGDGDGDVDVVTGIQTINNWHPDKLIWFRQEPPGSPAEWTELVIGTDAGCHAIVADDIDEDGKMDIISVGRGAGPTYYLTIWFQNSGPGPMWTRVDLEGQGGRREGGPPSGNITGGYFHGIKTAVINSGDTDLFDL